jgi:hypothetical protein
MELSATVKTAVGQSGRFVRIPVEVARENAGQTQRKTYYTAQVTFIWKNTARLEAISPTMTSVRVPAAVVYEYRRRVR